MQSPPHGAPARAAEPGRRHDPCPYVTRCRCARDARASARAARTDGVVDGVQRRQPRRPPRPRRGACGELVEQLELSGARAHSCCHDCDAARRKRTHSCDTCETARRALRERGAAPCRARGRTSSATWRSGCSSRRARASRTPRRPRRRVPSQLVGKRKLVGTLRGYDQFMNLVVEDAIEQVSLTEKNEIGTVVIRGARAASHRPRRPVAHAPHRRQLRRELRAHGARSADRPMHGQRHRLGAA